MLSELMKAVEKCYTPKAKAVMIDRVYDVKAWMEEFALPIRNVSNPHVFKITKDSSSDKVYLQYKNWASDKTENWKPESEDQDQWLELFKADVEIKKDEVPDLVIPKLEKIDLVTLRKDIKKFYDGSRVFAPEVQDEWTTLLDQDNPLWNQQEKPSTWPLHDLIIVKQRQTQPVVQAHEEGFLGERPQGVPKDIDDMIKDQVAPVKEVYTGTYRQPEIPINEVDDYHLVAIGDLVAVNVDGYRPPCLATVIEILEEAFRVKWLKGKYTTKWAPWPQWPIDNIPKESVIYFGFALEEDKLVKDDVKILKQRYKKL